MVWEDCCVQTIANLAGAARPATSGTSTTSREDFRALAAEHRVVPVTRKVLADSETPLSAYRERPVVVAVVVHRCGRAVRADGA
jgi:hypothetical protein